MHFVSAWILLFIVCCKPSIPITHAYESVFNGATRSNTARTNQKEILRFQCTCCFYLASRCIEDDFPTIYQWMKRRYAGPSLQDTEATALIKLKETSELALESGLADITIGMLK